MMGTSAKSSRYRSCGCCSLDTRDTSAEAVTAIDALLHTLVLFSSWQHFLLWPNAYLLVTGQKGYRVRAVCLREPASASPRKQNTHAYWGPGSQSLTTLHCHRQDTEQVRTPSSLCVRQAGHHSKSPREIWIQMSKNTCYSIFNLILRGANKARANLCSCKHVVTLHKIKPRIKSKHLIGQRCCYFVEHPYGMVKIWQKVTFPGHTLNMSSSVQGLFANI